MLAYFDSERAHAYNWSALGWFRCDKCGGLTMNEDQSAMRCLRCDALKEAEERGARQAMLDIGARLGELSGRMSAIDPARIDARLAAIEKFCRTLGLAT